MANLAHDGVAQVVIGVDTGGTFTDFVLRILWADPSRPPLTRAHKLLSTPQNPAEAVVRGVRELLEALPAELRARLTMVHGSTVATNALLERKGAKTAFITTRGFEDMLRIGRQTRRRLYDLAPERRTPLIPPERTFGLAERVDATGSIQLPLTDTEIERVVAQVLASGAESVAVCLLFSFLTPEHERRLSAALRRRGLFVSPSCEVLPEYREYERASTTVINAYVSPLMQRYLHTLEQAVSELGVERLHVMQSSGGCIAPEQAGNSGVHTVLSGPAGGVIGALRAARSMGADHLITFDMGGTSTDVALLPGNLPTTTEGEIDGFPVRVPILAIHTVGAGGGSIAYLDAGGALRVGPKSAGANPGPACYGLGGVAPTVTDAHVVLGRLPAATFLGGRMPLDVEAAREAMAELAARLGAGIHETAWGILQVANAEMERAIRVISIERGYDPGEFALVSFGGAGGLHAADLARGLGIPEILIPPHPGLLSAWGMSVADVVKVASHGVIGPLTTMLPTALKLLNHLAAEAVSELREEARIDGIVHVEPSLDVRYLGQSFELGIDLERISWSRKEGGAPTPIRASAEEVAQRFHDLHRLRYGHHADEPVELVAVRIRAWCKGSVTPDTASVRQARAPIPPPPPYTVTNAFIDAAWHGAPVYLREQLTGPVSFRGPAIVAEEHATVVVGTHDRVEVDTAGNIRIKVAPAQSASRSA